MKLQIAELKDKSNKDWVARRELFKQLEEAEANQTVNDAIDYYKVIAQKA